MLATSSFFARLYAQSANEMAKAEAPKWTESFREGVAKIMGQWKGLQMAVDHQFGGLDSKEKGTWLMEVAGSFMLENGTVYRSDHRYDQTLGYSK